MPAAPLPPEVVEFLRRPNPAVVRLGVLAAHEHLELDAEREVGREGVVNDGVHDLGKGGSRPPLPMA